MPKGRTLEQVWNHYQVERELADKLKKASQEERRQLYSSMYDELFSHVPDHPRLMRRVGEELTRHANASKLSVLQPWIGPDSVVAEFACGDCRFAIELGQHVRRVYGIDISDQRAPGTVMPANVELIVYDGYTLDAIPDDSVDVVFSDQLIEHLHPDEVALHFSFVHRMLKPGGRYVMRTPHALTGPHDVSKYFSDVPEGFHLHEWRYGELRRSLAEAGFSEFTAGWSARHVCVPMRYGAFERTESMLERLPRKPARKLARFLLPTLLCIARK